MDWKEGLPPAAKERLARVGALSDEEKAAVSAEAELDETLRLYFRNDIGDDELLSRLRTYERNRQWALLATARDRLQSSFKSADLRVQFIERADGSIAIEETEPTPPAPPSKSEGGVIELSDATFDEAVRDHPLLVVDCWAVWCGPCRMVAPVIEALAEDYAGRITFAKLDVDRNRATAARFQIQSIPTILIFKNGRLVDQKMGAMPRAQLEPAITRHLDGSASS